MTLRCFHLFLTGSGSDIIQEAWALSLSSPNNLTRYYLYFVIALDFREK